MDRNDAPEDRFVSRRKVIRTGTIAGLSTMGLAAKASAHDDEKDVEDEEKSTDEEEAETESSDEESSDEEATEQGEETDEETSEDEEDEEEEAADEEADREASVSISDHETSGGSVHVDEVFMSEGGFVSIHDRRRFDGQILPSIIGITDYLEPGEHDDVSVPLFTENATAPGPAEGQDEGGLTESQPLIAIPHRDKNDSGEFDGDDPAYKGSGTLEELGAVNDIATVFVDGDDEDDRDAAAAEEGEVREAFPDN